MDTVIKEYVNSAVPVSSQELLKKHDFSVSPATIRIEMQKLTDKGYLLQPHTSAGRVPTDKGYRLFVNGLIDREKNDKKQGKPFDAASSHAKASADKHSKELAVGEWRGNESEDVFKFIQGLTRRLAKESRTLAINYLENGDMFWKEGWEGVLQEPEFEERGNIMDFTQLLKDFEEHIEKIKTKPGLNVSIGRENPFPKAKNFTVISTRYHLPGGEKGVISIFGPKRMEYDKNITLINSLMKLLDNF